MEKEQEDNEVKSEEALQASGDEKEAVGKELDGDRSDYSSENILGVPSQVEDYLEPGVVEVQFHDSVKPRVIVEADNLTYRIESFGNKVDLSDFNRVLKENGCFRIELTFRISEELAAGLRLTALQQGVDVPDLTSFITLFFNQTDKFHSIAQALEQVPGVVRAAPVPRGMPPSLSVGDNLLGESDQLMNDLATGYEKQWYIFRCRTNRVWEIPVSGSGVVIAILDSGFLLTHVDLATRFDKEHRYNSVDGSCDVSQGGTAAIMHGTATAGIVGAAANSQGIVGFAHNAELWPIQASFSNYVEVPPNISWANAITWVLCADSGDKRKVILFEFQTHLKGNYEEVASINEAIRTAIANGVVVCVTAGNGNRDVSISDSGQPIQPTGSILVGATIFGKEKNERWEGSNWGTRVAVSAPGDPGHDITCAGVEVQNDLYLKEHGATSGAAAKVAGAVALMLEANPYIRHSDVREILNRTGSHIETDDGRPIGRFLNCEAAVLAARCAPAWGTRWQKLSGKALDITVAPNGKVWHLGTNQVIYSLHDRKGCWCPQITADSAIKIAIGAKGNPWYINSAGDIFRSVDGNWRQLSGKALDIDIGANGSVWHVGTDNRMYELRAGTWVSDELQGYAIKIAVGPDGNPWHINPEGDIYSKVGGKWQQIPGKALDLAIGADGSVWSVGLNKLDDGNGMYRWSGMKWEPIEGAAAIIAVASNGLPWHVNRSGDIFRRT